MSSYTPMPQEQAKEIHKIVSACMRIIKGLRVLHKETNGNCGLCGVKYPCETIQVVINDGIDT